MTNFLQVTPCLHVADLQKALDFFTDILGFTVPFRQPGYAYIHRETVGFRLLEGEAGVIVPGRRRFAYYVDVRDVDALYAELKPKLDTLPPGDVHGPADKGYNQRELLILAPDGELICFGMALPPVEVAKA
jgi:catechol 2,3-dioxygenase-like lactoylglutathione lyase family enzyme